MNFRECAGKAEISATSRPLYLRHIPPPCRQELEHAAPAVPDMFGLERRWRSDVILSGFHGVCDGPRRSPRWWRSVRLLAQPALAREAPQSFADLVDKLLPTVVNITTTQNVPQQGPRLRDMPQLPPGSPFEELFKEFFDQQGRRAAEAPRHLARLGLHHRWRRLHRHQQPRHPGRGGHHRHPARRHPAQGQADRLRQPRRPGACSRSSRPTRSRCRPPSSAIQRQEPGRRLGDRDRQSVRPRPFGDRRHHLGARPRAQRFARRLPADRRRHQQGQLGRSAVQCRRRGDRRQHGDLFAVGHQCRPRLLDPVQPGQAGRRPAARVRQGAARLDRRQLPERDRRHRRLLQPRQRARRAGRQRHGRRPGGQGGHQAQRHHPDLRRPGSARPAPLPAHRRQCPRRQHGRRRGVARRQGEYR